MFRSLKFLVISLLVFLLSIAIYPILSSGSDDNPRQGRHLHVEQ
jgi:hypothetical protein